MGGPPAQWIIRDEHVIDDTRRAHWSIATVELPDGVRFEQYLLRALGRQRRWSSTVMSGG